MAGDTGERRRLPKRPASGYRAEKASNSVTETDRIQAGLVSCSDRGGRKERRGKENSVSKVSASSRTNPEKMEDAGSCGPADRADPGVYVDEDSNHIFPVEQFFGNLDAVQVTCLILFVTYRVISLTLAYNNQLPRHKKSFFPGKKSRPLLFAHGVTTVYNGVVY